MGKRGALTSFLWKVITLCPPFHYVSLTHQAGQSLPQEGRGTILTGWVGVAKPLMLLRLQQA